MDSFSDRLNTVLSDPESMAKIAALAKSFAASPPGSKPNSTPPMGAAEEKSTLPALSPEGGENPLKEMLKTPAIARALELLGDGSRERIALLLAMRPFVREEKKEKLDHIIQTMKMLDLISSAQKLL
jgi:hypothetical protein